MAGLWESWIERPGEPPLESCTLLTGEPDESIAFVHDRMPVIVRPELYARWLDPALTDADSVDAMVADRSRAPLRAVPVGRAVNNARSEGPALIEPVTP
jgi:putative SOS response-associated peptidase YedK